MHSSIALFQLLSLTYFRRFSLYCATTSLLTLISSWCQIDNLAKPLLPFPHTNKAEYELIFTLFDSCWTFGVVCRSNRDKGKGKVEGRKGGREGAWHQPYSSRKGQFKGDRRDCCLLSDESWIYLFIILKRNSGCIFKEKVGRTFVDWIKAIVSYEKMNERMNERKK